MQWNLIVGPGARLAELLAYLVPDPEGGDCGAVVPIAALSELLPREPAWNGPARLLLDADALDAEDVGLVRAVMRHGTELELVLLGADATRRATRTLLRDARTTWIAWPPDLDDLKRLGRAPGASANAPAVAGTAARKPKEPKAPETALEPVHVDAVGDELAQIEAILGAPLARRTRDPEPGRVLVAPNSPAPLAPPTGPAPTSSREWDPAPALAHSDDHDHPALEEIELQPVPRGSLPTPSTAPPLAVDDERTPRHASVEHEGADSETEPSRANAPWFRSQVADLADLAQRIELGLAEVREGAQANEAAIEAVSAPVEALTNDVARLLQFARTLGYLVAPPARGAQRFDLGELVDVHTRALVERGAQGPRCLARKNGGAVVRSDRQLVSQALDALFHLAGRAAAAGEIVRVHLKTDAGNARLSIEFPAGPLAGEAPERIVEPYALRRVFPELGANALSAAEGIVRGQGGALALLQKGARHLEWVLELPLDLDKQGDAGGSAENPFA